MIKIKLTTPFPTLPMVRQTPGQTGVWGNCRFFINQDIKECDWWVVYEGLLSNERVFCPQKNTILITSEPPEIKKYEKDFIQQFETIITCHKNLEHQNLKFDQQSLPWLIGIKIDRRSKKVDNANYLDYDFFKSHPKIIKNKLISVISSTKNFTAGHRERLEFLDRLKKHFGSKLDIYGDGINNFADKWEAIAPYKYHIVLENSTAEDYWSEKLSDSFLGEAFPFYWGCDNIEKYFPAKSLVRLNTKKPEISINSIDQSLNNHLYESRQKELIEAKTLVLEKYNLFAFISNFIESAKNSEAQTEKELLTIHPEKARKNIIKKALSRITNLKSKAWIKR